MKPDRDEFKALGSLDRETGLELYRQLMESQRDNTRIAYSWIGNIFLVLSSALVIFGLSTSDRSSYVPAMVLGVGLSLIWAGLTEVFAAYIRERFDQAAKLENELGFAGPGAVGSARFKRLGWRKHCVQARTYVWVFAAVYVAVWILGLILKF